MALGPSRPIGDDQADYLRLSEALLGGMGFGDPTTGLATAYRDPGYPILLAVVRPLGGLTAIWIAQLILSSATGSVLYLLVHRASGARPAAISAVLFLSFLAFAAYGFVVYAETLACFLVSLTFLLLFLSHSREDNLRPVIAGAGVAVSALTRAATLPLLLALTFTGGTSPARRTRTCVLTLLIGLGAILLWSGRNLVQVGVFAPNSNGVVNLYLGNNPRTPLVHAYRAMRDSVAWAPLRELSEAGRSRVAFRLTREYVLDDPGRAILGIAMKMPDVLEADRILIGLAKEGQFPERTLPWLLTVAAVSALSSSILMILGLAAVLAPGDLWIERAGRWMFLATMLLEVLTIAHPRFTLVAWVGLIPGASLTAMRVIQGEKTACRAAAVSGLILVAVWGRQLLLG